MSEKMWRRVEVGILAISATVCAIGGIVWYGNGDLDRPIWAFGLMLGGLLFLILAALPMMLFPGRTDQDHLS